MFLRLPPEVRNVIYDMLVVYKSLHSQAEPYLILSERNENFKEDWYQLWTTLQNRY